MNTPTAFQVRAALLDRGWTVTAWAKARGYAPATVSKTVARWTQPRQRSLPHGITARRIITDLTRDLDMTIVEGITPSDPPTPNRNAA